MKIVLLFFIVQSNYSTLMDPHSFLGFRVPEMHECSRSFSFVQAEVQSLKDEIDEKRLEMTQALKALAKRCGLTSSLTPKTVEEKKAQEEFFEVQTRTWTRCKEVSTPTVFQCLRPLPKTIVDIERKINEEKGRMAASKGVNRDIVKEYEDKKGQCDALQRRLEQTRHQVRDSHSLQKLVYSWGYSTI